MFHEFQDLRTPICSGFCACSYVSALLRSVVILGTAVRRFLHNDAVVDSRAKPQTKVGIGSCLIHITLQILECYKHLISISVTTATHYCNHCFDQMMPSNLRALRYGTRRGLSVCLDSSTAAVPETVQIYQNLEKLTRDIDIPNLSVHPSVCLSVTYRYQMKMA